MAGSNGNNANSASVEVEVEAELGNIVGMLSQGVLLCLIQKIFMMSKVGKS